MSDCISFIFYFVLSQQALKINKILQEKFGVNKKCALYIPTFLAGKLKKHLHSVFPDNNFCNQTKRASFKIFPAQKICTASCIETERTFKLANSSSKILKNKLQNVVPRKSFRPVLLRTFAPIATAHL